LRAALLHFESSAVTFWEQPCFKNSAREFHFYFRLFQKGSFTEIVWEFRCFSFRGRLFHSSRTVVSVSKNGRFSLQEQVFQFSRTDVSLCMDRCYNFNDENKAVTLQDGQQYIFSFNAMECKNIWDFSFISFTSFTSLIFFESCILMFVKHKKSFL
jgi:hypothetical protein